MPGQYTIKVDTSIHPVEHARRKVPIEARGKIEKALQKMVDNGIITPVTEPTKWVSSLTYHRKSDGTIHPCLDPRDLNKAIIHEHYKAPTLEEISHKLSSATVFSKLDAKDGFWSIHLDTPSSYLTTFNTHTKDAIGTSTCHLDSRCPRMFSRCAWTRSLIDYLES